MGYRTEMDLLVEAALKRAVMAPGCPICRVGEEAVQHYLRFVLHESVNDLATRSLVGAAWGFCRGHAWHFLRFEWETFKDGTGTATIAEGLIETAEHLLDRYLASAGSNSRSTLKQKERGEIRRLLRKLTPTGPCPACDIQKQREAYALTVLQAVLSDPEWRERFSDSDGLCLAHLRLALDQQGRAESVRWLIEDQSRRLKELKAHLGEYLRKHSYQFRHEPYGRERDAAVRATAALAGSWFELPGGPTPRLEAAGLAERKGGEDHG